ncbi:hypothetical protein ACFXJO_05605 [Streptomyces lavendulae]|uniref:hypothetical protein n=1 Tax=Streptomyces lavendulae TaxID=1914 RepID=UPI00367488E0
MPYPTAYIARIVADYQQTVEPIAVREKAMTPAVMKAVRDLESRYPHAAVREAFDLMKFAWANDATWGY